MLNQKERGICALYLLSIWRQIGKDNKELINIKTKKYLSIHKTRNVVQNMLYFEVISNKPELLETLSFIANNMNSLKNKNSTANCENLILVFMLSRNSLIIKHLLKSKDTHTWKSLLHAIIASLTTEIPHFNLWKQNRNKLNEELAFYWQIFCTLIASMKCKC